MPIELMDSRGASDEVLAALRRRAVRAREEGHSAEVVADVLGVTPATVYRWHAAYKREGEQGLPGDRTGRPVGSGRDLAAAEEQRLQQLIEGHGPDELGIASALWSRRAVADLIERECSFRMPLRTVGEYLRRWGYTPQKPRRKSYRQDPQQVDHWLKTVYPRLVSLAKAEGAEIHWGDEVGVRSTGHVGRGYARPGHTPQVHVAGARFSVNMISTVTNQGKLRFMIYEGRMTAEQFIAFLVRLIRDVPVKIFLIVDNLSVHEATLVKQWVEARQDRIELHFLPTYSPELNPDEYLNCDLKNNLHTQGLPHDRPELKARLRAFMQKLAKLPGRVASYFQHPCIQYAASGP